MIQRLTRRLRNKKYQSLNTIELSQNNLLSNLNLFHERNHNLNIIPVIKANAYGHGLLEVARILNQANCEFVAVDSYFEANTIKNITKHQILVLGYTKPANAKFLDSAKCSFVIQDNASLEALGQFGKVFRIHLELNTGMNRLGLSRDELNSYLETLKKFPNLQLEGVMTHLADADNDATNIFTDKQVASFDKTLETIIATGLKPKYIHVAQTAGSTKTQSKYANCIRLGIGLYGINPLSVADKQYINLEGLKPVLKLKSTLIKVIDLEKGDRVSYNELFSAPKKMKIGILPLGYYEGLPLELSNKGLITHGSYVLPIVGKVCMNHTMIDLGNSKLSIGDEVTVIDNDPNAFNSVKALSDRHNLFSRVLVTKLSSSVHRVITD